MADADADNIASDNDNNWFGSWLSAAKNKGSEVLKFVKKDLEEFGSAVKVEATNVVSSTGAVLEKTLSMDSSTSTASNMKRSFNTFLGQMNTILNPSPDDSDTEVLIVENSETVALNKSQYLSSAHQDRNFYLLKTLYFTVTTVCQKMLYDLQKNPDTFLLDPDEHLLKQYQCWLEIVDDQFSAERIAKHINSSEILKNHHARLVPEFVADDLFWKRYLFKKALLEDELAKEEDMNQRKKKIKNEDTIEWEHEDFAPDIELTEEEQIKLLEQYERELNPANQTPKSSSASKKTTKDKSKKSESLTKVDSATSSGSGISSSSSFDGDWEKISDTDK